jgi:enterobactin synthetase component F
MLNEELSCPLSAAQQEVCLAIGQEGRNLHYHLCDVIEFNGNLQTSLLEQAIRTVCQQAETVRAAFEKDQATGQYRQRLNSTLHDTYFSWHDLSTTPDPEQAYSAMLEALLTSDMDLAHQPLIRFLVVKLADRRHCMVELGSHLVVDGFGHAILFKHITDCYVRLARGEAIESLPAQPLSRVFEAEQAYRQSESYLKDQSYWRQYCLELPAPTQLVPGDMPLRKLNRLRKTFSGAAVEGLREAATLHRLRLSSVLLAACATYLYRMTGQSDLAVGMPVAARQLKALREIPAMVANILPLRISFTPASTILSVAADIQRQLRRHLLHQGYRSEAMIRDLYAERGQKPLFNTLLNIVAYEQDMGFDGCEATVQNVANGPADHLGIDIFDRNVDGRLEIGFNANADLYPLEALELHYARMTQLLEHFAAGPDTLAEDYPLLLPGERERYYPLLAQADASPVFADAFTASVRSHGHLPALRQGERELSYAELDDRADRLACLLLARGVRPGDDVAVIVSRSVEWAVAAVALFKLGAGYVPVDPELPEARIEYILADAAPAAVIVTAGNALKTTLAPEKLLFLDAAALDALPPAALPLPRVAPAALSYLIYTSGSTGKPKGVEVTHRNLVPIADTAIRAAELQAGQRVLQFIAAGFDMSVLEIMMTLLAGATLVICDKVSSAPGKALAALVKRENIKLLVMTPSLLAYHQTEDFPRDTVLMLGGEPCTPALLARFSHCRLLNVYGPTETSFATSINADYGDGDLSIGTATANTRLYVVDPRQRLLPPGAWGDLFIGGPGVARGYRNSPELTAKGFVPDILDPSNTMYRAGDRVFFDHAGRIHYQGRQDNQIKLRGLRIELDEIKNALLGCSGVEDAVALLRDLPQGPAIVGYVANQQLELDSEGLKQALSRQLPHHMIPSVIMVVPVFPLTPNGKLATGELPTPTLQDDGEQTPPRTPEEEIMCRLFATVLECGEVYANQNFFALGGHSLLGLQLINNIRETFGVSLGIADFLAAPTPRQLVQRLERPAAFSDPFDAMLPLRVQGSRPPLFCIHPGGGIAWPYAGLLPFLPEDQPLYAIQSPILRDPDRVIGSLDELAQEYRQRIQAVQPRGPYQLAGWSVGGNLALRLAAMLQADGHEVSFLCMFDSYPLQGGPASLKLDDATIITRMTRAIVGAPRAGIKGLKSAMEEVLGGSQVGEEFLTRLVNDSKLMLELLARCCYQRYDGDLIFIRATTDILRPEDQQPSLWQPYISGKLIEYEVNAPHECLLQRQYLEQFGAQFSAELQRRAPIVSASQQALVELA